MNLFNNAIDQFTLDGKNNTIIINIEQLDDRYLLLSINDNAGGIKQKNINLVFEKYFTTKKNQGGSGLGLFMSKMIVEDKIGGNITVENKDGGASFNITIPIT